MNEDKIRTKAQFFFDNNKVVHIKNKSDRFFNGFIKEMASDFMIFDDRIIGETIIFFIEIKRIDIYQEVGDGE